MQAIVAHLSAFGAKGIVLGLLGFGPLNMLYHNYTRGPSYDDPLLQKKAAMELRTADGYTDMNMAAKLVRLTLNTVPLLTIQFHLSIGYATPATNLQYISIGLSLIVACVCSSYVSSCR